MTPEFTVALTERLEELTADLAFDYQPDGSTRPPQIINPMLPRKGVDHKEGQTHPFVRWAIYRGSFARRPEPFSVIVSGGIYTAGSIDDGNRDILSLALALGRIIEKRTFFPYRLQSPVEFTIGAPAGNDIANLGLQPHPYYYMSMILEFLMP